MTTLRQAFRGGQGTWPASHRPAPRPLYGPPLVQGGWKNRPHLGRVIPDDHGPELDAGDNRAIMDRETVNLGVHIPGQGHPTMDISRALPTLIHPKREKIDNAQYGQE